MSDISSVFLALVDRIANMQEVQSIGRSGGRALPASCADGDIDVFIYCDALPAEAARRSVLDAMGAAVGDARIGVFSGGHWGAGDFCTIGGVETWLMYMTETEALAEVESVLNGGHPCREGNYYPTGRCAMYLGMEVLLDRAGFLVKLKERLSNYPDSLSKKLTAHHLAALGDTEDFERAVARRDPLFYHFALEAALDHFLQALFAMNRVFFPSRKRSLEHIAAFASKPMNCEVRLLETLRLGGTGEGIEQSYSIWTALVQEIQALSLV